MNRIETTWAAVREHPAVRAGAMYAGAGFVVLQVMDLLGMETTVIRWTGALLTVGFIATVTTLAVLQQRGGGAAWALARIPGGRRLGIALVAFFVLGSGAWWTGARLMGGTVAPGAERIAVLPFSASGVGAVELGEGMVDLLATSLDQVGGVSTVHPRTVMHRWAQRAGAGATLDLAGSLAVGREVGAGSVLLGSVVQAGERVRLSAELRTVDGEQIGEARTEGLATEVLALVDDLAVRMLREVWRSREPIPNLRLAAITTSSVDALEEYLRGERFYRASSWDSAAAAFSDAVALDSTFALAYLRLGESLGWQYAHGHPEALAASEKAVALGDRLPARDRTLAIAHLLHESGAPEALDTLASYVGRYPDDAYGWYLLGDIRYHAAVVEGLTTEEQSAPVDSSIRLDPTHHAPLFHLMELALWDVDSVAFHQRLDQFERAGGDPTPWRDAGRVRFAPADSFVARFVEAYATADLDRAASLTWQLWATTPLRRPDMDPDLAMRAVASVGAEDRPRTPAWVVAEQHTTLLVALGRVAEARRFAGSYRMPDGSASFHPFFLAGVAGYEPTEAVVATMPTGIGLQEAWLRGQLGLVAGDPEALRSAGVPPGPIDVGDLPPDVPTWVVGGLQAMEGWAALLAGDTVTGEREIQAGLRSAGYANAVSVALAPVLFHWAVHLTRSDAHREEGIRRLEALRVRGPVQFLVPVHMALGEAYEASARPAESARHYAEVVRLWADADPPLQPTVRAARQALERLTGEGA